MVDTISAQYSMDLTNKNGYILYLPNVGSSGEILQRPDPDPYAESAEQLFPLGTRLERGEQTWKYCQNATTALTIAIPIQAAAVVNAEANDDIVVGGTGAIGANTLTLTSTTNLDASPADEYGTYNEGYIYVNNGAGQGQCRKIQDCDAFSITLEATVKTYEDWTIAVTAADGTCGIFQNPYKNVVVMGATGGSGVCVGVTCIPITEDYYFWAQTKGPCAVLANTTIAMGTAAVVGTSAGEADPQSARTVERIIGFPMTPGVANDYCLVFLSIDK